MDKSPDAFRTISEVAEWLGVQAHVLRFWESKFTHVKPVKRAGGRRYYRPADMQLLGGIKKLLHDDGLTIKGVQKILREQGVPHVSDLSQDLCDVAADAAKTIKAEAKIVPFKPTPAAEDAQPAPVDQVANPPAPDADPTPVEDITPPAPAEVLEPPAPEPVSVPPVEDKPILPSFLHRPAVRTPEPEPVPEPESVVEAKKSLVVEAPDPPDESDIPYSSGPLAKLAKLDTLSAAQAARIAPLARELQAWLVRSGGAGAP